MNGLDVVHAILLGGNLVMAITHAARGNAWMVLAHSLLVVVLAIAVAL